MYMIDCPDCGSNNTHPTPETAFERFCLECDAVWDIRPQEEIDEE